MLEVGPGHAVRPDSRRLNRSELATQPWWFKKTHAHAHTHTHTHTHSKITNEKNAKLQTKNPKIYKRKFPTKIKMVGGGDTPSRPLLARAAGSCCVAYRSRGGFQTRAYGVFPNALRKGGRLRASPRPLAAASAVLSAPRAVPACRDAAAQRLVPFHARQPTRWFCGGRGRRLLY